ncbi:MAG: LCP family protein, partial [Armatimonadota bacterium]
SALPLPRDIWGTAQNEQTGRINEIYNRGGAPLLRTTVASRLGAAPDYYVAVRPGFVQSVVGALEGVQAESLDATNNDKNHFDDDPAGLHIHLRKGLQMINGTEEIGFARYVKVDLYKRD